MTKQTQIPAALPADRILNTATELFYMQGYRATGINEIIKRSGVAKATFYSYFPGKDVLGIAYLKGMSASVLNYFESAIDNADGTLKRFLAIIVSLEPWLIETNFRGCAFLNIASEVPDYNNPLRKPGIKIYTAIHQRVTSVCAELIDSNPNKYRALNATDLSKEYMVILVGAVTLSELYNDISPARDALKAVCRLTHLLFA